MFKLQETSIPANFSQVMTTIGRRVEPDRVGIVYDTLLMAMSDFLAQVKSKENKTAIAVKDLKGNLLLAGIVNYHKNENEDMPGNWSYELTFNEDDLNGCNVSLSTDPHFNRVFLKTLENLHGLLLDDPIVMQPMIEEGINVIKQWLDVNAKENEEVSVEHPGFFVASVSVENGEKVYAIVPDGAMKRLIKDDSALEE